MEKDLFDMLVDRERTAQDTKWGEQNHTPELWLAILMEEIGEASTEIAAMSDAHTMQTRRNLEHELIQCAAVIKAIWESGKRNGWLQWLQS